MTFTDEVIQRILAIPSSNRPQTLFFPNKQALIRFKQQVSPYEPRFRPSLYTFEEWVIAKSQLTIANQPKLVTLLYKNIQPHYHLIESFERFYSWGNMLLQDFDWMDRCLVNADHIFRNLYNQRKLDRSHDYLTPQQKEAVQTFWRSFGSQLSRQQQDFLDMISLLPTVYQSFQKELLTTGIAYPGLCYKYVTTHPATALPPPAPVAFMGFNYLYPAAEKLIGTWHEHTNLIFYWDLDAYYMADTRQEAGHYLRSYQQKPYYQASFTQPYPNRINAATKRVQYLPCYTSIEQVQQTLQALTGCLDTHQPTSSQIAIVLADENLLLPLVTAWPASLPPFSTTMGYPLRQTLSYQLIELLIGLQVARYQTNALPGYGPSLLLRQLLHHPFINNQETPTIQQSLATPPDGATYIELPTILLDNHPLLKAIVGKKPATDSLSIIQDLLSTLPTLSPTDPPNPNPYPWLPDEQTAITLLAEILGQLSDCLAAVSNHAPDQLLALFTPISHDRRLPFKDRPHPSNIPIVSMEETLLLDPSHVFILGMNEGVFPTPPPKGSFVPYNLRRAYNLPTLHTFQPATGAYLFYRLLQRAQQIWITYNLPTAANHQKEMSRYLWQLQYESQLPIEIRKPLSTLSLPASKPLEIPKDPAVMALLDRFLTAANPRQQGLTPTALNSYIDCSLQFYFRYLCKLQPPPTTPHEATRFGILFHQTMEKLYTPWAGPTAQPLQVADIQKLQQAITSCIQSTFTNYYQLSPTEPMTGQQAIEQAVMEKIVRQLLSIDRKKTPFKILGLEVGKKTPLQAPLTLANNKISYLQGIIDRIDDYQGTLQIIDYKTGKQDPQVANLESLFQPTYQQRNKAVLQLLLYSWLVKKQAPYQSYHTITPHLIQINKLFEPNFESRLLFPTPDGKGFAPLQALTPHQEEIIEKNLATLLNELLDPAIPFSQTPNYTTCSTCPYQRICSRC